MRPRNKPFKFFQPLLPKASRLSLRFIDARLRGRSIASLAPVVLDHEPCDLAQVVVEAAGELGPVSGDHDIVLDVHPAVVEAARDELHRLTVNLVENALRHTPAGTQIHIWTAASNGHGSTEHLVAISPN